MAKVYINLPTQEKQYTKKALTFPVEVSDKEQDIVTTIDGKDETKNKARIGDYILTGTKGERYILTPEKFKLRYKLQGKDKAVTEPVIINAKEYKGKPISFVASWGEEMIIEEGDYLIKKGNEYYRIEKGAFANTYTLKEKAMDKVELIKLMVEAKKAGMDKEFDVLKRKLTIMTEDEDIYGGPISEEAEYEEYNSDKGFEDEVMEDDADHPGEDVEEVEEEEDEIKLAVMELKEYGLTKEEIKLVLLDALEDVFEEKGEDDVEQRRRDLDL